MPARSTKSETRPSTRRHASEAKQPKVMSISESIIKESERHTASVKGIVQFAKRITDPQLHQYLDRFDSWSGTPKDLGLILGACFYSAASFEALRTTLKVKATEGSIAINAETFAETMKSAPRTNVYELLMHPPTSRWDGITMEKEYVPAGGGNINKSNKPPVTRPPSSKD